MRSHPLKLKKLSRAIALLAALSSSGLALAATISPDHQEFGATLYVPYQADASAIAQARTFTLNFEYPQVEKTQTVSWRVELLDSAGVVLKHWYGVETLVKGDITVKVDWAGREPGVADVDGIYQVRLTASSVDATDVPNIGVVSDYVENSLNAVGADVVEQTWDMQVGYVAPVQMPTFSALPTGAARAAAAAAATSSATSAATSGGVSAPALKTRVAALAVTAPAGLPYTVYLGNLHSQSGHSDGGGTIGSCTGEQVPQSHMDQGPTQAYQYAMNRGLDILVTSEHNHMFDGSTGTNTAQTPSFSKGLYATGLALAANFNVVNPNFLAIYGMEWGTISTGGHMNIFNSPGLYGWEYNAKNELLADTFTDKGQYTALYTVMAQQGAIGQFNHPNTSDYQSFAYTEDGNKVMTLCEVVNSSAFSNVTDETGTTNSGYESACKKALLAGFHVAFSSDQDNHCANWGASAPNRTGVLIPNGTPLSLAAYLEALKARRVFATTDKTAQLVMTANGHLMGETFVNAGPLTLQTNYASSTGKKVSSVEILQGVPKGPDPVGHLSSTAVTTFTPALGEHFYYAKVTQSDGKILWSAPVWVSQVSDATAPTVTASATVSSGTVKLAATATDDVGVTRVDFYVDGSLKGNSITAPYSLSIASTSLSNGNHTMSATALDAAGNAGNSGDVGFSVSNVTDVTSSVRVTSTGLLLNRATQLFNSTITLTNTSASTLNAPLQLEFVGLPAGVSLQNASGTNAGAPYITLGSASLAPGASIAVPVSISNPAKVNLGFTVQIFSGSF
ncbi:MAG TPA: CehA/McbA family metallohydrolase [Burkholderiaceae bacterium]|jgi:hypothetical protein